MSAASNTPNSAQAGLSSPQVPEVLTRRGITPGMMNQVKLTIVLMTAGYVACLLSGFGTFLEKVGPYNLRALPLFLYAALLLITLHGQIIIETNKVRKQSGLNGISPIRAAFTWLITVLALIYAVWAFFLKGPGNPVQFPETYLVMNLLALAGFLFEFLEPLADIMGRSPRDRITSVSEQDNPSNDPDDERVTKRVLDWASHAGGLSAFCLLAALILALLANGLTLPIVGTVFHPYVVVPISWFPLHRLMYLQDLDVAIGLFAAFVTLVFLGFVFALDANHRPALAVWERALWVARTAFQQSSYSFRFAISPLIWVVPAFSIAEFAKQATAYFSAAATTHSTSLWDFFDPFSATSVKYLYSGLGDLALALGAILMVLLAVAAYEYDAAIIRQALRLAGAAGRIFVYFFPVFLLSLTVLNAALALLFQVLWPFQLIVATIITTILALLYLVVSLQLEGRVRHP